MRSCRLIISIDPSRQPDQFGSNHSCHEQCDNKSWSIDFSSFQSEIYIYQSWTDARLITFNVNYTNIGYVYMDSSITAKIWKPDTYFSNVFQAISPTDENPFSHRSFLGINEYGTIIYSQRLGKTHFFVQSGIFCFLHFYF